MLWILRWVIPEELEAPYCKQEKLLNLHSPSGEPSLTESYDRSICKVNPWEPNKQKVKFNKRIGIKAGEEEVKETIFESEDEVEKEAKICNDCCLLFGVVPQILPDSPEPEVQPDKGWAKAASQ